jgi:hypothetical protein
VDPSGLATKEFAKAYDEYLSFKNKIYNINWKFDLGFLVKSSKEQLELLDQYNNARNLAKQLHYNRNQFNTNLPNSVGEAENIWWSQMTGKWDDMHQVNIPKGQDNQKWVSSDWHREAVFYFDWKSLVTEDENIGTYNFYPTNESYYKHRKYDMSPYEEWWNTPNDTTTEKERYIIYPVIRL